MTRAAPPASDARLSLRQLELASGVDLLQSSHEGLVAAGWETVEAILDEAVRFASDVLVPLNALEEKSPPRLEESRVRLSEVHRSAWRQFVDNGWLSIDLPAEFGGQGMPLAVSASVQEIFDRACPAFGMLSVPIRSAVRLLQAYGGRELQSEWLPKLVGGEWGATICISEAGAGSDLERIKTAAVEKNGGWTVTGEKTWISFGDHDLTSRIGHFVLAKVAGERGLSLFLVPSAIDGRPNGVHVRRLEEKLGLHLSPTCGVGFEDSRGFLLGETGRGLAQMFVMIVNMRLSVAAMGLGIASGAADIALQYAQERAQGGSGAAPKPIIEHPDVQRQLLDIQAPTTLLRGLIFAAAAQSDLAQQPGHTAAADAASLAQWLLPIIKTLGGEIAFDVSSGAIQVLGGAGYTKDWPVEQSLRDARVLSIFEGTTGIQALDLLHRRLWKDQGRGLQSFCLRAERAIASLEQPIAEEARSAISQLQEVSHSLEAMRNRPADAEAGATAFLHLAGLAALTWIAATYAGLPESNPVERRLRSLARYWLTGLSARARAVAAMATITSAPLGAITDLLGP